MNQPKNSHIAGQFAALSARHKQVVALVCRGLTNKMIAEKLGVSEGTVKGHLHAIYGKLGILSRYQLIMVLADLVRQNSIDFFWS
jgi:DNA-binding NarL/FixJ family response regulator